MAFTLVLSIIIKAISAIFEIGIQILITRYVGVAGYGNYTFLVNIVEISYWIFFSGMVKCNTFYLSDNSASISVFKKKYYVRYMLPILFLGVVACLIIRRPDYLLCVTILVLYFFAFNVSSTFMARGAAVTFLLGEYLIGRIVLLGLLAIVLNLGITQISLLFALYGVQYLAVLGWFFFNKRKIYSQNRNESSVDMGKLWQYQQSDIANGLISQSPVILQYLFVGAYETGFVGIVVTVKKLVNFISGPTAKIFLPEFSRLYRQNKIEEIRQFYNLIVRIQMVFVATVGVALLGFSELILNLFSPELVDHVALFRMVAIAFLIIAGIGPGTGLMQMTGQEKLDNIMRWISIALMVIIWILMRDNSYFALYGLVAQALSEGVIKYIIICRWFHRAPISIGGYIMLWSPAVILVLIAIHFNLGNSYLYLLVFCVICGIATLAILFSDKQIRDMIIASIKKQFSK